MIETTYNNGLENEEQPKNYKAEGDAFVKNLKDSTAYCRQFFFDTEETDSKGKAKKKLCQIASLRSKLIYDLKRDYGVDVKPDDVSTILYKTLWSNGSWAALNSYEGKCSFFAWLKKVAKNAVVETLEQEGQIRDIGSMTMGNTRLALLSQSPAKCQVVIDDMLGESKYHDLLTDIYVDRVPQEIIMKKMGIDEAEFDVAKKNAEKKLKDALLRSVEFSEEDLLRSKKNHVVTVSSEFVSDIAEWYKAKVDANVFSDVFGTDLSDEEVHVKAVEFLYDFSAKMEWSDRDRYIWCRRFIEDVSPVDVAMEVERDRAWLDTRYSRLNAKFKKAVKEWWKVHSK